jgi:hypothetical protein
LSEAYHCLAQDPYVQVALWFPLQDEHGLMSGLVRANGTRKPSFDAMRSYVQNGDQLNEQCGVLTGPKISVLSPAKNVHYNGPLPIHVFATSSQGIFRITLKVDGKLIRNYGGSSYPATLSGYLEWQGAKHIAPGKHVLTFLAYDQERNVSETSLTVYHGGAAAQAGVKAHGNAGVRAHGNAGVRAHGKIKRHRRAKRHPHHGRHR